LGDSLTWHWHARIEVEDHLSPDERAALLGKLRQLHDLPRERWEEQEAYPLQEPLQATYLVPFNDEYSVYFTPQPDGKFHVEDIVSQERLDQTAEQLERMGKG
jgi:hypothetical protein